MIEAKIVCDSVSPQSHRLTTFLLRYPKWIHGELMTHRVLSRNASSSRAVPVSKNIEEVRSDALRAGPVWWGREQKGMASGEELPDIASYDAMTNQCWEAKNYAQYTWKEGALAAVQIAEKLYNAGVHKSIVNRVLEPYLHINTLVSATEYMNFFGLRLDKAAQPEMRVLAETMWRAYNESTSRLLQPGEWHLPFILGEEVVTDMPWDYRHENPQDCTAIKVSVARCARLSYMSFETGKRSTVEEDLRLYDRLVGSQPLHASPAEHQATPDEYHPNGFGGQFASEWLYPEQQGNLIGWRQYRKMIPGEALAPLPVEYR